MTWAVERSVGSAADFHARAVPAGTGRQVWVLTVDRPALVLGSTQGAAVVDHEAVTVAGVEVVRRRSGGGAVLLEPGGTVWVDVVLPADDPLADEDVGRAFHWLGGAWAEGLAALGLDARVHRGPLQTTAWSHLVCFGGLGPGEVTVDGAKAVGMSQRRTRASARFQCAVPLRWDADRLLRLLALTRSERTAAASDLLGAVVELSEPADAVVDAFLAALPG